MYAVTVTVGNDGQLLKGALNIGTRPTFNGTELRIEVYILDFDRDIYDAAIRVDFRSSSGQTGSSTAWKRWSRK